MNTKQVLKEILAAEIPEEVKKKSPPAKVVEEPEESQPKIVKQQPKTSIDQEAIDDALEIATFVRDKSNSLLSEANQAIENLSGDSKASVLESKDDFHTLVLRLKQMKRRLNII
jgi:chromosomal replication initiation ATPase DnaA